MNIDTAREIANLTYSVPRRMIDAIRLLRTDSSLGLIESKTYLETTGTNEQELFDQLCKDFVQSKVDLLIRARYERTRLDLYIKQLEQEIDDERNQNENR